MNFKFSGKILFVTAALGLFVPVAALAETTGKVTFHKGWKKRSTPFDPVWSPSQCGSAVRRVPNKRKKYRVSAKSIIGGDRQLSEIEKQKLEDLKKKLNSLRQIHEIQKKLINGQGRMSRQQQRHLREKIQQLQAGLEKDIAQAPDFPFPSRMHEIEQVVLEISDGNSAEYQEFAGQSEYKILNDIHDRQIKALIRKTSSAK